MALNTITIQLERDVSEELDRWAHQLGRSPEEIALEALADWLQDQEDIRESLEILSRNEPARSIAEVRERLALER